MIVEQISKIFNLRDCERHFELIAAVLWDISVHNSMLGFWAFGNSNSPLFLDFRRKGFFRAWHCTKAFFPDIALLECNRRGVKLANITSNIFFFTISEACLCLVAIFLILSHESLGLHFASSWLSSRRLLAKPLHASALFVSYLALFCPSRRLPSRIA